MQFRFNYPEKSPSHDKLANVHFINLFDQEQRTRGA
jgi:hypothetical protein